jgi:small subunit ribosomal protein S3
VGQKVNPIGLRLGIIKTWDSKWYATKRYSELLKADEIIRKFVDKKFSAAGISKVEIKRASKLLWVNIHTSRPGIIIGKKGAGVDSLKDELAKLVKTPKNELNLNVYEVKKPDLDATLVADSVKQQLEKRVSFRRAMKKAIAQTMKAGAKGIKIQCSGRLGGADMARVERYREGRVPLHTLRADIDYGTAEALTTYGLTGVKVWIFKKEILDKNAVEGGVKDAVA